MIREGSEPSIENADLSIIMPVYNTEETYLRACLSSIEACVAEGICIDVVIVDDGSTFDYCKSLNAIASSYSFGARVLKKSNGGQNSARAYGLARAKGKYVLFADSDDRLVPSELKRVLDAALAHLPKILCFNFDRVNPDGSLIAHCDPWQVGYRKIESLSRIIPESDSLFRQLYYRESIIGSGVSLVEGARIGEDMASAVALLLSIGEAASIDATPYLYVQRPTSALHSVSKDRVLDIISSVEGMLARIPYKARSEYHQELESLCIEHLLFWGGGPRYRRFRCSCFGQVLRLQLDGRTLSELESERMPKLSRSEAWLAAQAHRFRALAYLQGPLCCRKAEKELALIGTWTRI